MKQWIRYSLLTLVMACYGIPVQAQAQSDAAWQQLTPNIVVGGSVRLRYEMKQDFAFGAAVASNTQDYWLHQLRLHMQWQPSDKVLLRIEGQDARIHSATLTHNINNEATPNIFEDHFDIHQAYVDVFLLAGDSTLRMGRQKLNLGVQRMVASLEWVNTARVWDGIRWTSQFNAHDIDIFATQLVPVNPTAANNHDNTGSRMFNSRFNGIYYSNAMMDKTKVELYLLQRLESKVSDDIRTLGLRVAYQEDIYDADAEWMSQSGEFGGMTHDAFAYHVGMGMKVAWMATHIGVAYNFGSGDSDATDNQHQTFDNLYPLNHAYYGFMDFFSLQNMRNAELVLKSKLSKNLMLRTAWQGFWLDNEDTDAWYNAGAKAVRTATTDVDSSVGQELDLTLIYKLAQYKMKIVGGYSRFFSGDYIQATGSRSAEADVLFVQVKWNI